MTEERQLRPLQSLDAATSEARSLLRRAARLSKKLGELGRPELERSVQPLLGSAEELLTALEEARAEERARLRRQLLGEPE